MFNQKNAIDDLAILGGSPAFQNPLHVGCPNIGDRDRLLSRINDILDRRWLSNMGCYVQEFEQRIANMLGVRHCIAICNGTVALEIAIRALELKGEVILPAFTFIATAHALQWQEITPIFCDIDPHSHNLDPAQVEALITPRTTGIVGVHVWGRPCAIDTLQTIANTHHLKLLFDAAHAFGCSYQGQAIGQFGDVEVLSFHATKFINTLEGGAIVTNNDELAHKIRLMRNFGFTGYDRVEHLGTNGKMNEISAAMGLTGLDSMSAFIDINCRNYQVYQEYLSDIPGINLCRYAPQERSNYQYIVLEVDPEAAGVSRDTLLNILHAENILARRYFYPGCHRQEPYCSQISPDSWHLPHTEQICDRVLLLPTGMAVEPRSIQLICHLLRLVVSKNRLFSF